MKNAGVIIIVILLLSAVIAGIIMYVQNMQPDDEEKPSETTDTEKEVSGTTLFDSFLNMFGLGTEEDEPTPEDIASQAAGSAGGIAP